MTREVHHYKVLDPATGEWVIPPIKCTADRITQINGKIIDGTMSVVARASLDENGCYDPAQSRDREPPV